MPTHFTTYVTAVCGSASARVFVPSQRTKRVSSLAAAAVASTWENAAFNILQAQRVSAVRKLESGMRARALAGHTQQNLRIPCVQTIFFYSLWQAVGRLFIRCESALAFLVISSGKAAGMFFSSFFCNPFFIPLCGQRCKHTQTIWSKNISESIVPFAAAAVCSVKKADSSQFCVQFTCTHAKARHYFWRALEFQRLVSTNSESWR